MLQDTLIKSYSHVPELMSFKQVDEVFGIKRDCLQTLIESGVIKAVEYSRIFKVFKSSIIIFLSSIAANEDYSSILPSGFHFSPYSKRSDKHKRENLDKQIKEFFKNN